MKSRIDQERWADRRSILQRLALGFALLLILPAAARAQVPAQQGRQWAILIAVEKYQSLPPLRFTANDVTHLAETLRARGNYAEECVLEITDDSPAAQPTKAAITAKLGEWLKKPGPQDQVLVFFSGHGVRDKEGKMYLAPIDCDRNDPTGTGIPVAWLREQLTACPAVSKLLVLDACHAGSEKGEADPLCLPAETLGAAFKGLDKVVTLASSTAEQKSQIWDDKRQSLFSYWLNQGLRGNADKDGDGNVDIHELFEYVDRTVSHTAKTLYAPQNPVLIRSGAQGVPVVVHLKPLSLREVLDDMAEKISDDCLERHIARVGVLEFGNDAKLGEMVLGGSFGLLGSRVADELEQRLVERSAGKFTVVERRQLQEALKSQGFSTASLKSPEKIANLATVVQGGLPAIAQGTLRDCATPDAVSLQCKLLSTGQQGVVGAAGGIARLNPEEWGEKGHSVAFKPTDTMPQPTPGGGPPPSANAQVIQHANDRAQGPHPLQDPNCPYRVRILVGGQERKLVFRGNDAFVGLRKGEVYEIRAQNLTKNTVRMRLLVDGLNTLPELEPTKGVETWLVAPRVALDSARAWFLPSGVEYGIAGFFSQTGAKGEYRQFTVVDAAKSVIDRQQFGEQLGLITAAFYEPAADLSESRGPGGLATDPGAAVKKSTEERKDTGLGNRLMFLNIHYVDADSLAAGQ